ncbi:cystathionine beta-lyase [Pelagimonas sp. KU-00592-HH]|uniref:cystathionine beta-lyase n=1 Tax=Pelagimonas sp. KU-00592-HH TaxID=3127651 RepID=UPI003101F69D
MTDQNLDLSDALVHLGRGPRTPGRAVNLPITQGSTMLFDTLAEFEAAREARYQPETLYYGRYGNPASFELEKTIATLEGGAGCISVSAGLTAVTLALMGAAKAGDHVLVADTVYTPTRNFCDTVLQRYGVEVSYFDPMQDFAPHFRTNTTVVMFEAPGSGTFEVPDIPAIAALARAQGAISIIDGTWATPVFCQPLKLGVDVVVHSGSKYIGGHADSMIGFIVCNEATYAPMRKMVLAYGDKAGSQDVFLSMRGLRTLEMRMKAAEAAGYEIASFLQDQPQITRLLHPGFADCPGHDFWRRDFTGAAGLFSVVTKPCSDLQLHAFVDALELFGVGVSWGGYESLVLPVAPLRTAKPWDDPGRVLRFNVGFENIDSLKADLARALPLLD